MARDARIGERRVLKSAMWWEECLTPDLESGLMQRHSRLDVGSIAHLPKSVHVRLTAKGRSNGTIPYARDSLTQTTSLERQAAPFRGVSGLAISGCVSQTLRVDSPAYLHSSRHSPSETAAKWDDWPEQDLCAGTGCTRCARGFGRRDRRRLKDVRSVRPVRWSQDLRVWTWPT